MIENFAGFLSTIVELLSGATTGIVEALTGLFI